VHQREKLFTAGQEGLFVRFSGHSGGTAEGKGQKKRVGLEAVFRHLHLPEHRKKFMP
jgi:hypothetical protein